MAIAVSSSATPEPMEIQSKTSLEKICSTIHPTMPNKSGEGSAGASPDMSRSIRDRIRIGMRQLHVLFP